MEDDFSINLNESDSLNERLFSLKEINSSFANEINSIKNVMISNSNNNSDYNKLKNEINELNEKFFQKIYHYMEKYYQME